MNRGMQITCSDKQGSTEVDTQNLALGKESGGGGGGGVGAKKEPIF